MDIVINEEGCQFIGDLSSDVLKKIDEDLSFEIQGAQYMPFFGANWSGRNYLLTKDFKFPYGLLNRVKSKLNDLNITCKIIDVREQKQISKIDISKKLTELGKEPRYYQTEAANKVYEYDCGVFRMATGSGKTITSAMMIANLGKQSIFYVIGIDLLHQTYQIYKSIFGEDRVGIVGDGHCNIKEITVASVWTIGCALGLKKGIAEDADDETILEPEKYKQIKDMLKTYKVHIFDECHACAAMTFREIQKLIRPEHIYGMSGSPWRDDGADLLIEALLGNRIMELSASVLIEKGYLVKPIIKFVDVPRYGSKLPKQYNTIYKHYITENEVRNELIRVNTLNLVSKGYQTLILYNSIAHGKILYEMMAKEMPCILLSGKDSMKIRDKAKDQVTSGECKIIIASKIFDVGIDLPSLSGLVLGGAGKSSVRALQRIGRVIRPAKNKKYAAVVDFNDNAHYLKQHSEARRKIYSMEEGFEVRG